MSVRYSSSPALHLIVGKSRVRRVCHIIFCSCIFLALYLLYAKGYLVLVGILAPPVGLSLWQLRCEAMAGAVVHWQQGLWSVEHAQQTRPVTVRPRSTCLGWLIYFAWQESLTGRNNGVWLFLDSAPRQQLRLLRLRLAMER